MNTKKQILEALADKPNRLKLFRLGHALGVPELCAKASGEPHLKYRGRCYTIYECPIKGVEKSLQEDGVDLDRLQRKLQERLESIRAKFREAESG